MENSSSNGGVSKLVSQLLKKFVPDIDSDERKQIALRRYCIEEYWGVQLVRLVHVPETQPP